jgi:protein-S-isoprenylcysteine O-methyltransferase Ste14
MPLVAIIHSMILQTVGALALAALLLFLPAGTFAWPQGWLFLALFFGLSQALGLWLLRTNPALLAARMKSPLSGDQAPRDRAVAVAILACFLAWLVFIALDAKRFGWSHAPAWAQAVGALLIVVAFWGWMEVLRANSFAATTIELQTERGQTVISSGPYALVRHPMYAFALLLMVGAPLMLGSLWGLAWLGLFLPLLAARALGEEAILMAGLAGYADYARQVRFRLVPGIW